MSCNCSTTTATQQSCAPDTSGLERVNYFPRQIMTVDDMVAEADYFREKLRRHNRYLHGWGVVCGLDVTAAPIAGAPARVQIGTGYALGPYGDEIYVGEPVFLDLSLCSGEAGTDPCEPNILLNSSGVGNGAGKTVVVAIEYFECVTKPVRAMPAGCACEEEDCEYSRVRDSFRISCLNEWAGDPDPSPLCELRNKPVLCPPTPTTSWVVLAKATLPVGGKMIDTNLIDTKVRRQIFTTSQIQNQVIKCCCKPPLLKVGNVRFLKVTNPSTFNVPPTTESVLDLAGDKVDLGTTPILVPRLTGVSAIEVQFVKNVDVNGDTVKPNFIVTNTSPPSDIPGDVNTVGNTATWTSKTGVNPFTQSGAVYQLKLTDAIKSQDGTALDGEATQLPSGNDQAGGDFILRFTAGPGV